MLTQDRYCMHDRVILLTGATGFIGRNLLSYCASRHIACRTIARESDAHTSSLPFLPGTAVYEGDVESPFLDPCVFAGIDAVVHLAALVHDMNETRGDIEKYRKVNRDLTLALARAALNAAVPQFVFVSTVKVMGDFERMRGIATETDQPNPSDVYGISKLEAERGLAELFAARKTERCTILRLPMVYGPGNKGNMLSFLRAASRKIPLPLKGATGKRSVIYVGNVCDAIAAVIEKRMEFPPVDVFFLSDGVDCSSADLYSAIYREMHGRSGVYYVPGALVRLPASLNERTRRIASRLFDDYRFSSEKFRKTYGWQPRFSFEEGICETVAWYKHVSCN